MEHCLCGKEATHRFWGVPRCGDCIEGLKHCFQPYPPTPGSLAEEAIEPIKPAPSELATTEPNPLPPPTPGNTFQFWKAKL